MTYQVCKLPLSNDAGSAQVSRLHSIVRFSLTKFRLKSSVVSKGFYIWVRRSAPAVVILILKSFVRSELRTWGASHWTTRNSDNVSTAAPALSCLTNKTTPFTRHIAVTFIPVAHGRHARWRYRTVVPTVMRRAYCLWTNDGLLRALYAPHLRLQRGYQISIRQKLGLKKPFQSTLPIHPYCTSGWQNVEPSGVNATALFSPRITRGSSRKYPVMDGAIFTWDRVEGIREPGLPYLRASIELDLIP